MSFVSQYNLCNVSELLLPRVRALTLLELTVLTAPRQKEKRKES